MKYLYQKRNLIWIGITAAVYNAVTLTFPLALMQVTDNIIAGNMDNFLFYIGLAAVSVFVRIAVYVLLTWMEQRFIMQCMTNLRKDLLKKILRFNCGFFEASDVSRYSSFMINDLKMLEGNYYAQIISRTNNISMLILACISIFVLNPVFLAVAVCIYMISVLVPALLKKKIVALNKDVITSNSEFTKSCEEAFNGFSTIKVFGLMKLMCKKHSPVIQKSGEANMRLNFLISISNAILAFLGIFMTLFVFIIGGWLVVSGILTAGALVALAELLAYTIEPIAGIIGARNSINSVQNVINNCDEIFAYTPKEILSEVPKKTDSSIISVKNLNFRYANKEMDSLTNVNFNFQKEKKYAIIGGNGSGKSTFLKLLSGLYEPKKGELLLSGNPYNSISETERREKIIYMEQNSYIFNFSIEENITFQRSFDETSLSEVIETLELDPISRGFGSGENVPMQTLSGGEKQRVSLARCLLKLHEADVFLADEPTSAMDGKGQLVFNDIVKNMRNKTCIVVTHRLDQTLDMYDKILVMQNGELIDVGTYKELEKRISFLNPQLAAV